jgi:hypothetical protein
MNDSTPRATSVCLDPLFAYELCRLIYKQHNGCTSVIHIDYSYIHRSYLNYYSGSSYLQPILAKESKITSLKKTIKPIPITSGSSIVF